MKPSDFKVGDRVRIVTCQQPKNQYLVGKEGVVTAAFAGWCWVKIAGHPLKEPHSVNGDWNFWYTQVEHITTIEFYDAVPQPQTTQQKEDTVMYSVINYSHLTGGVNVTNYNTEAEAKTQAERIIAGYRSNIQVKQYFTVSVIELKTGKLIGSVVDAPPAVDWATS